MGVVNIICCGKVIYRNTDTYYAEKGVVRCDCGCAYEFEDVGGSKIVTKPVQVCNIHSAKKPQQCPMCGK